jgi:hypothetical protein
MPRILFEIRMVPTDNSVQWDCWKVETKTCGTLGKLVIHLKGYVYHQLWNTELIQTVLENRDKMPNL